MDILELTSPEAEVEEPAVEQVLVAEPRFAPREPAPVQQPGWNWFAWRTKYGFGWLEAIALTIYAAVATIALYFHEPWGDEAQAWLIARDSSFWQTFHHRLHYEGTPALWPFFLHTLHLAHVPYAGIGFCAAIFAVAGIYAWLRYSPLPLVIRILFPFTFYLQYQYAVVARSYVFFALLLFTLCALYTAKRPHLLSFAIVAGLLANLCMQGMVVAGTLALLYAWDLYRNQAHRGQAKLTQSTVVASIATLTIACGVSVYTAIPAPDVAFAVQQQVSTGMTHKILVDLIGETPHNVAPTYTPMKWTGNPHLITPGQADFDVMSGSKSLAPESPKIAPLPVFRNDPRGWLAWQIVAPTGKSALGDVLPGVLYSLIEFVSPLLYSISTSNLLACVFLVSLFLWALARRSLLAFLPFLALLLAGEFLWIADHHVGMLLLAIVAGVWLTAERSRIRHTNLYIERCFLALLTVVIAGQVLWSAASVVNEIRGSYDPGRETAQFLKRQPAGTRIAGFHWAIVSTQPYFTHNPYFNLKDSWWDWNRYIQPDAEYLRTIFTHPDIVVVSRESRLPDEMRNQIVPLDRITDFSSFDPILADLASHGYVETNRFCGHRFARLGANLAVCDLVFRPSASNPRR